MKIDRDHVGLLVAFIYLIAFIVIAICIGSVDFWIFSIFAIPFGVLFLFGIIADMSTETYQDAGY